MAEQTPQNLCIIIGDPISSTLSPLMHTSAYRSLGLEDRWAFVPCWVPAGTVGRPARRTRPRCSRSQRHDAA